MPSLRSLRITCLAVSRCSISRAFGDLDAEATRRQLVFPVERGEAVDKVQGGELALETLTVTQNSSLYCPFQAWIWARLAQYQVVEVDDQAGVLGNGDELPGDIMPFSGWPAHQRLKAFDLVAVDMEYRLIVRTKACSLIAWRMSPSSIAVPIICWRIDSSKIW